MSVHGIPEASLRNAVSRATAREKKIADIIRYARANKRKIHSPEAYAEVVEVNARHGLVPSRRTQLQSMLHFVVNNSGRKRRVTLPKMTGDTKPRNEPRAAAEEAALISIEAALKTLWFHYEALGRTPNPHSTFRNRVSQQALYEAIRFLDRCVVGKNRQTMVLSEDDE